MAARAMDWTPQDVALARQRLATEIPELEFCESDYGYSLSVRYPGQVVAFHVFRVARPERGDAPDDAIAADVDDLIATFKRHIEVESVLGKTRLSPPN